MFSGRVFELCSARVSRFFLCFLVFMFTNLSSNLFAGIELDDVTVNTLNTTDGLTYTNATDAGVIVILNSAADLNINILTNQIDANYGSAANANTGHTDPNAGKIAAFYADPSTYTAFDNSDHIAIINITENNTTFETSRAGIDGILGNVVLYGGDNTILGTGPGDIIGSVDTGDGVDTINFSGIAWIHSNVNTRGGNDSITLDEDAFIDGDLDTGDGDDTVLVMGEAYIDNVVTGIGNDTVTVNENGSLRGNVDLGTGNDILVVSGANSDAMTNDGAYVDGNVDLGDGNDTVTVGEDSEIRGTITGGIGNDSVTLNDNAEITAGGSINLGAGNDTLTLNAGTTLAGSVDLGADDDTATFNSATVGGNIDLGEGTDTVTFNNTDIAGNVTGGTDETDTVTFNNSDFTQGGGGDALDLETGINILNLNNSDFEAGTTVTLNGAAAGHNQTISLTNGSTFSSTLNLTLGAGSTGVISINNSTMTLGGNLAPGNGALQISVTNNGVFTLGANNITGGTSDDILTLGSGGALTAGTVDLGAGNNQVSITGTSVLTGNLTTGTGENTFTFGGSGTKVSGTLTTDGTDNIIVFNNLTDANANLAKFTDLTDVKSLSISGGGTITGGDVTLATGEDLIFSLSSGANFQRNLILTNGNSSDVDIIGSSTFMANLTGSANADNIFIENSTFTGNIDLAGGNDVFNISGSTLTGNVELGAGTNTLTVTNSTITGTVDSTGGVVDTATFNGSTIGSDVTLLGAGITFDSTGTTFSGNVALGGTTGNNIINLTNSTVTGNLTLGNDAGNGDTLTLNNSTINGTTDAQAGTDSLILNGSGTISTAFNNFENLTLNGTSWTLDNDLTLNAGGVVNINSGSLTVASMRTLNTGGSDVNIASGSSLTLIGNVNAGAGATDINGTLNLNGGTLTSTGGVTVDGSLLGNGSIAGASAVVVNGTIGSTTAGDTINIADALTLNDGSVIQVGLSGATGNTIAVTGNVTDNGTTSVNVNFNTILTDGQQYNIITAAGGIDGNYTAPDSSFVYDFAVAPNAMNTALVLTASRTPFGELNSQNSIALRPMLTQLEVVRQANPNSQAFLALEQLSQQEFDQALLTINPSVANNMTNIATTNAGILNSAINSRLDLMQSSMAGLPIFAGPEGPDNEEQYGYRLWTDVNYKTGEQDMDGLALGYDFSNYNFSIGTDKEFQNWLIGVAGTYSTTDISYDENGGETEAESFSLGLYSKYFDQAFFWDNYLTVSFSDLSNDRQVNAGQTTTIDSSSDALVWRLGTQVGYKFESDSFYFTPVGGISFGQSSIDGLSESGSVFAVETDDQDYMSLQHKIGFRTGIYNVLEGEDFYTVEFRAFWHHEYLDTDRDVNARFVGGGSEFEVTGIEADADIFVFGLGVMFDIGNTQIKFDYDYEMSSSYKAHNLSLNWVMKF